MELTIYNLMWALKFKEYLNESLPDYDDFRHPQMKFWLDVEKKKRPDQNLDWSSCPPGQDPMFGERNYETIDGWMYGSLMSNNQQHAKILGFVFAGRFTSDLTGKVDPIEYSAYTAKKEYIDSFPKLTDAMRAVMDVI